MPEEPAVAPGSPRSPPPPGTPRKKARPLPGCDSEQDSGFSDSGSEHLGRCEGTDPEEPPAHLEPTWSHTLPGPQPPGAARDPRPLLVLLRPPAGSRPCRPPVPLAELSPCPRSSPPLSAIPAGSRPCRPPVPPAELSPCPRSSPPLSAVPAGSRPCRPPVSPELSPCPRSSPPLSAVPAGSRPCRPPVPPAELSPCPRSSPPLSAVPVGSRPCRPPVSPADLSPCPRSSPPLAGALLAALALRTGALLRHNRRTQGDIATLRRHTRLLARATRDPRVWPRLCHLLGPSGGHREPPGAAAGGGQ